MNEHITGTVVPRDESITLLIVEPLNFSSQGATAFLDAETESRSTLVSAHNSLSTTLTS
jgi:hypothetical protein